MRGLALAAALCALAGRLAQAEPPRKPAAARAVDDARSRQLLKEAAGRLRRGDYAAAESASLRLLQENIRVFGPDHPNVATALNLLGAAHLRQGKFNEAEGDFRRMLTIYEKRLGPEHEYTAAALNSLALVLEQLGDYKGAETLLRRASPSWTGSSARTTPTRPTTLSNLCAACSTARASSPARARTDQEARGARRRRGAARPVRRSRDPAPRGAGDPPEDARARSSPVTANSMSNLGRVLDLQGKYAEAEKMYREALAVREKALGRDHPDIATNLNNLAKVMQDLGKDESIGVSEARARARAGGSVGATDRDREPVPPRARRSRTAASGASIPRRALTLNNLGGLLATRGDFAQAEQMQRAALATMEKVFGEQHPDTAAVLTSLALALDNQGKIVEAEATYQRAVEISRKSGNPRSPAGQRREPGLFARPARPQPRGAALLQGGDRDGRLPLLADPRLLRGDARLFLQQFSAVYRETIRAPAAAAPRPARGGYDREALAIASRNQSRVFTELMRQADVARFSGEPAFVRLRESRDQLQERVAQLRNSRATVPVTLANAAGRVAEFDAQLTQASIDLIGAEEQLWREYPRFMELANPRPVTVEDLQQKLLKPGETLLSYVLLPSETVIFAVTPVRFRMNVAPVKRAAIAERVAAVRRAIEKVAVGESVLFLREVEPEALHSLYRDLLAPVADLHRRSREAAGRRRRAAADHSVRAPGGDLRRRPSAAPSSAPRKRPTAARSGPTSASTPAWTMPAATSLRLPAEPLGAHFAAPVPEARGHRQARPGGLRRPDVRSRRAARR